MALSHTPPQAAGTFKWGGPLCPRYVLDRAAPLVPDAGEKAEADNSGNAAGTVSQVGEENLL